VTQKYIKNKALLKGLQPVLGNAATEAKHSISE